MRRNRPTKKRAEAAMSSRGSESKDECLDLVEVMDDRVELLQQSFKCLRTRELQSILPEAMKNRPVTNIKEECLDELLGISSKRLRSILDETVPPSDTESSSDEKEAVISLDSISSDESNLNTVGDSKKKRHKHKESKKRNKKKGRKARSETPKATHKNITVLELLELNARARAIRAQLHKEPSANQDTASGSVAEEASAGEDDDVVIKEEPHVVVELSSDDDEKPDLVALAKTVEKATKKLKERKKESNSTATETCTIKKKNDLTIITPKKKISKRIKLKRVKFVPKFVKSTAEMSAKENSDAQEQVAELEKSVANNEQSEGPGESKAEIPALEASSSAAAAEANKKAKKKKRTKTAEGKAKEDSDKDEITLQLSDTEKMDLLEDNYPKKKKLSSNTDDSGLSTSEEEPSAEAVCVPPETSPMEVESDKAEESNTAPGLPASLELHPLGELQLQPTIEAHQIPTIEITESDLQEPYEPEDEIHDIGIIEMETQGPSNVNTQSESQLIANENSCQPFADISTDERPAEVADELEPSIFDVVLEKESSNDSEALQIQEDTRNVEPDTELALRAENGPEAGPNITQVVEDAASITQQGNPAVEPAVDIDENATPHVLTTPKPKVYLKNKNKKNKKGKK